MDKGLGFKILISAAFLFGLFIVTQIIQPKDNILRGLLVDLELGGPDISRHKELRKALTQDLAKDSRVAVRRIELDYSHFSQFAVDAKSLANYDFLILSPQGAPWHTYKGELEFYFKKALERVKTASEELPVLGICGGHQFLALAFGGSVGFIDPALKGKKPLKYPKGAVAEKGLTTLDILAVDPIFNEVADLPGKIDVMQSHYEEVKDLPDLFVNLARSEKSEIQVMRMKDKPVYGVAFHPERLSPGTGERFGDSAGAKMLVNFMRMASERKL